MRRPRDYDLYGFRYDAMVLAAHSHYLNARYAATLVDDPGLEAELTALKAIFDARAEGVHEIVWWSLIDRVVCTCGLVMTSAIRQDDVVGHLDFLRYELAGTILTRTPEGSFAACQHCTLRSGYDELGLLREWQAEHVCPPDVELPHPPRFGELDPEWDRTQEEYFFRRMVASARRAHPWSAPRLQE